MIGLQTDHHDRRESVGYVEMSLHETSGKSHPILKHLLAENDGLSLSIQKHCYTKTLLTEIIAIVKTINLLADRYDC